MINHYILMINHSVCPKHFLISTLKPKIISVMIIIRDESTDLKRSSSWIVGSRVGAGRRFWGEKLDFITRHTQFVLLIKSLFSTWPLGPCAWLDFLLVCLFLKEFEPAKKSYFTKFALKSNIKDGELSAHVFRPVIKKRTLLCSAA